MPEETEALKKSWNGLPPQLVTEKTIAAFRRHKETVLVQLTLQPPRDAEEWDQGLWENRKEKRDSYPEESA